MRHRPVCLLAATLVTLAAGEPTPTQPPPGPGGDGGRVLPAPTIGGGTAMTGGGVLGLNNELMTSRGFNVPGRQVKLSGFVDAIASRRYNATDADANAGDARTFSPLRAHLGFELTADPDVVVGFAIGWHARAGGRAADGDHGLVENGPGASDGNAAAVVVQRADIRLQSFLGFDSTSFQVGRSAVATAVSPSGRRRSCSLLFDSRADDRDAAAWDGATIRNSSFETVTLQASVWQLPDQSRLWSARFEWQPATPGDDRWAIAGAWSRQTDLPLPGNRMAEALDSYYLGATWNWGVSELWAEGAVQRGDLVGGAAINAYGLSAGIDWQWSVPQRLSLGLGADLFSGDDPGSDWTAFSNPHETIADTLLFEDEAHGELLRGQTRGVRAFKLRLGYAFDEKDQVGIDLVLADYQQIETAGNGSRDLGRELDLSLIWKLRPNTTLRLFTGAVEPGAGLVDRLVPGSSADDLIFLVGGGLSAAF